MSFDVKEVVSQTGKIAKKYPWLIGGGLVLVGGLALLNQNQNSDNLATESALVSAEPATASPSNVPDEDVLSSLQDYIDSSLTAMGGTVADTLAAQNDAVSAALAKVALNGDSFAGSGEENIAQPYVPINIEDQPVAEKQAKTTSTGGGLFTKINSANTASEPVASGSIWDWAKQNSVPVSYDQSLNTVTINGKSFKNGQIPGTTFDPASQSNKITDVNMFTRAVGTPSNPARTTITPTATMSAAIAKVNNTKTSTMSTAIKQAKTAISSGSTTSTPSEGGSIRSSVSSGGGGVAARAKAARR